LRTNWREAAWISSSVAGGSKLKSVLMFLHMLGNPTGCYAAASRHARVGSSTLPR
jgi:hypothetical protein